MPLVYTVFGLVLGLACVIFFRRRHIGLPLPPGPKPNWLGQVSLPLTTPWVVYAQWKELYGDFFYIRIFGSPILVINSIKVAQDLLEKKGSIYSSRPYRTMVMELMGWDWIFSSMPYTSWWRRHRTLFHQYFHPNTVSSYDSLQSQEVATLLRNLLRTPSDFAYHIRRTQAAIVLKIAYGHQVKEEGDDYISLADAALTSLGAAGLFGTYAVDYMPWLKYLPSWLPGASFKRKAAEWYKLSRSMVDVPYAEVKRKLAAGTASTCFVAKELESLHEDASETEELLIKNVAAITYAGGADTTSITLTSFVLAMLLYPEVVKKAQAELDQVVGYERLPSLQDFDHLPYSECLSLFAVTILTMIPIVRCIVMESLRWNPVTPLALAHYVVEDDVYENYRIPKGTTIIPNVWAMLHDPEAYPDPMSFNPGRFTDPQLNLARKINGNPDAAFGFGRRICPGRWLAFNSLFLSIASILAVFDILPTLDDQGKLIIPKVEYTTSLLSRPKPFQCRFIPRSKASIGLVTQTTMMQD